MLGVGWWYSICNTESVRQYESRCIIRNGQGNELFVLVLRMYLTRLRVFGGAVVDATVYSKLESGLCNIHLIRGWMRLRAGVSHP